ncbi:MAG: polysaccharide pyruvyl transferase family protein [Bacteroidales bacterium]|nr:polysaccharide pyruvyl transferase family protein [Bacteroidales bacterium]
MNIKIITIHAMHNPGSVFQCYALQTYLEEQGCSVQIINYLPKYLFDEHNPFQYFVKKLLFHKVLKSRGKKFEGFINKELHLTKACYSFEELVAASYEADLFLTGSDQLWNGDFICGRDPAYYLKFTDNPNKASFSTSAGKTKIDSQHLERLKRDLQSFKYISVRESSTAKELSDALGREVEWVCDPVFLLKADDYYPFISQKNNFGNYVLVYMAPSSPQLDNIVNYYKNKGYTIVLCGGVTSRCKCDVHIKDSGPEDFLTLIKNAQCVISTSFHATAFCHIFHVPFITIMPEGNNERIRSLVDYTGLESRAIELDNNWDISAISTPIDWERVDTKIESLINGSKAYLKKVICGINKSENK